MAGLRIALLGGSDAQRAAKREVLEANSNLQIVFDSDGFGYLPDDFEDINFDVAIIEQRLGNQSAFDFIKELHTLATADSISLGRLLVSSQFHETKLRVAAIEAGAVDCLFVSDGPAVLIEKVKKCTGPDTDFAIRELFSVLGDFVEGSDGFQHASVTLETLDKTETNVLNAFCQLKSEAEISIEVGTSKVKVRAILLKIQTLLMLHTRSQLLLEMYRLGALAL